MTSACRVGKGADYERYLVTRTVRAMPTRLQTNHVAGLRSVRGFRRLHQGSVHRHRRVGTALLRSRVKVETLARAFAHPTAER
jgi:hypothetical protein